MSDQQTQTAIAAFLDAHHDRQIDFLRAVVKVPSDNPPGDCTPHAEAVAPLLEAFGWAVERHVVPEGLCRANGMISATNLVVRRNYGDGPVVALNAHGDVVPPGDGWTHDPYGGEIVDGWLYGRGAAVSKSDFATFAFAVLALENLESKPRGTVELHFTYDEEAGGVIGPKWLLDEGISKPDYVICPGFSYDVVTAHNGCLHLEVTVKGRSAHAAQPDSGHDALRAANKVLAAIYAQNETFAGVTSSVPGIGSPSVVVGLIEGGINTNVVPDRVSLRLDRRMIPEEDPAKAESDLRAAIESAVAGEDGISVDIDRILLAEPMKPIAGTAALSAVVEGHASRVFGETIASKGVPLYADGRHYVAAGIPTVMYGAGPRTILEANAHRADERVRPGDVRKATEVVALSVFDLLT